MMSRVDGTGPLESWAEAAAGKEGWSLRRRGGCRAADEVMELRGAAGEEGAAAAPGQVTEGGRRGGLPGRCGALWGSRDREGKHTGNETSLGVET